MCPNHSLYVQRPYARSMVSFPVMFCVFVIYFVLLYIVRVSPNERTRHFVEYTENGFAVLFITDLDRSVKACVVLFYWLLQHRRSAIGILLARRPPRRSTLNLLHSYSVRVSTTRHTSRRFLLQPRRR